MERAIPPRAMEGARRGAGGPAVQEMSDRNGAGYPAPRNEGRQAGCRGPAVQLRDLSKHLRRDEPPQLSHPLRRNDLEVDTTDCALLEFERRARPDEPAGELTDIRFVPDQRDSSLSQV